MTASDWVTVVAVLLAPILAVQVQKRVELLREKRTRKKTLFQTLMATRAARLSPQHVQALNMIDIEFYGSTFFGIRRQKSQDKSVLEAWKTYLDHLNTPFKEEELGLWSKRGEDLFIDLLYEMARCLRYDFDKVQLRRAIYSPRAHGDEELAQLLIRDSLVDIFSGKKTFPITVVAPSVSEQDPAEVEMRAKLIEYLDGKRPVKVVLEDPSKVRYLKSPSNLSDTSQEPGSPSKLP